MSEIYFETDWKGKHRCVKHKHGVITKMLVEPSEEYKKKSAIKKIKAESRRKEEEEKQRKEKLIKSKMRDMAIEALKKEGKL